MPLRATKFNVREVHVATNAKRFLGLNDVTPRSQVIRIACSGGCATGAGRMTRKIMEEPSCFKCGAKTGGDLRKHKDDCSYIKELCEKYQACRDFLAGKKEDTSWSRKGPRKNKKH